MDFKKKMKPNLMGEYCEMGSLKFASKSINVFEL